MRQRSQVFQRGGQHGHGRSRQLQALDQLHACQPLVRAWLKQVAATWNFIEKPLQHYKEKSVPFIVVRYSNTIVTSLAAAEQVQASR